MDDRSEAFRRNEKLEMLLKEINGLLAPVNADIVQPENELTTKIFLVGPMRSGSTLIMQWLASMGSVRYPTNLLSRFYEAPLIGARIQQLLTNSDYNFRNEMLEFSSQISFDSENGKTVGAIAPNEFWYFWRRFLPFEELDYMPEDELISRADLIGLRNELNCLANYFNAPFALKAMIMNQNIPILDSLFEKAVFVWTKRDAAFNIQSVLEARMRQLGTMEAWYSFKIREYPSLKGLDPLKSVAGQIHSINSGIERAFSRLPDSRKIIVPYEEFCESPELYYRMIIDRLSPSEVGADMVAYKGNASFEHSNSWRIKEYSYEQAVAEYQSVEDTVAV